jgi:hypothetical protein
LEIEKEEFVFSLSVPKFHEQPFSIQQVSAQSFLSSASNPSLNWNPTTSPPLLPRVPSQA